MATTTTNPSTPHPETSARTSPAARAAAPRSARRAFRMHHQAPTLANPVLSQLCREWVGINADPDARDAVAAWGTRRAALRGFNSPADLLDELDQAAPARVDAVALALLEQVHDGDQLAGRVLLQLMLPALANLVRRSLPPRGADYDEQLQRALTEFWAVIGRPRSLPRRRVLARLQLDTLHRVSGHRRSSDAWEGHTSYLEHTDHHEETLPDTTPTEQPQLQLVVDNTHSPDPGSTSYDPEAGLYELVLHARASGVLTAAEAQFLVDVYLNGSAEEHTLAEAARRLGLPHTAVRQRCTRLRSKLVTAVLSDLGEPSADHAVRQAS